MDETLRLQHGDNVAKIYENLKLDLLEFDNKYQNLKNKYGQEQRASQFYRYSIEPVNLFIDDDTPDDLRMDIIGIFDKHFKNKIS